jgi:molybdate transport system substrate-binding protein
MKINRLVYGVAFAFLLIFGQPGRASAADIQVLCSNGFKAVFEELVPQFERATGHKVIVKFGLAANFKQQIDGGESFDLAILTPALIDDLIKSQKTAADTRTVLARTGLGIMIKAGARKPDVRTPDSFKKSLLDAQSIAYAREGASGVAFAALIEKLGINETLKPKLKPTASGEEVNDLVVRGGAQYGILPLSEILAVKGAELGGMFPADVQTYITMATAVSANAKQAAPARDLIRFLMAPAATTVVKAKGMERN